MQAFDEYAARVSQMTMEPLRITAHMAAPVVNYAGLHLDGILAYTVVEALTLGQMLPQTASYIYVPLPLRAQWHNVDGVPLWASTDMQPVGAFTEDTIYMHRRAPEPHMTLRSIHTTKGRHKELRTPMPALAANALTADVIGCGEEIARLLASVTSIGKKRGVNGAVLRWSIDSLPGGFSFIDEDGRARRPLPHAYLYNAEEAQKPAQIIGFSPPYWHIATRARCVPAGVAA